MDFEHFMRLALDKARLSGPDVPVGALIVSAEGEVLSLAHNLKEARQDPTAHAEIEAIRAATERLGDWRLLGSTLVVTLEPCVMCAGAIIAARIPRVVFGAWDEKVGAAGSAYDLLRDHRLGSRIEVTGGVLEKECAAALAGFFRTQRNVTESPL